MRKVSATVIYKDNTLYNLTVNQSVRKALDAGYPVIASVSKGDFTTQGHFIVLAGTDEDGKVIVHDPNSVERSAKVWDLDRILSQTRNLWAFSV